MKLSVNLIKKPKTDNNSGKIDAGKYRRRQDTTHQDNHLKA